MPHPLVDQLRFTRSEFMTAVRGVPDDDARKRLLPMNSISWNVGHLAWQEQRYFVQFPRELTKASVPYPDIAREFEVGAPGTTPPLDRVLDAWRAITTLADEFLDGITAADLSRPVMSRGKPTARIYGNLLQRTIYHYWYHTGETMAIRQQLGHERLPQFVGNIDDHAPYRPDAAERD